MQSYRVLFFYVLLGQLMFGQQNTQPINYDTTTLKKQVITEQDLETYKADDAFNYFEIEAEENVLNKFFDFGFEKILNSFETYAKKTIVK